MASLGALVAGLVVDAIVLLVARYEPRPAILLVAGTLAFCLALAWAMLRLMTGGNPSQARSRCRDGRS